MKISAVILAKNEEKNIERAIKSVKFCDEVILIDDESVDDTVQNAEQLGAVVYKRKLDGQFDKQRNYGLDRAVGDWILFIDADEEVSSQLKQEIMTVINSQYSANNKNLISAYYIKRRDYFWGREMKYGEIEKLRNTGIVRLIKKNSGYWEGKVHEIYKIKNQRSKIKKLSGFINHYPHQTIKEFLQEVNYYSNLRMQELFDKKADINILQIVFYPLGKFMLTYFIKLGFLDGAAGFTYAFFMAFHSFLVRAKLFQLKRFNLSKTE